MDKKQRLDELTTLYENFELETTPYRDHAACAKGCAFCCTRAGSIDITTLEGLRIRETVSGMLRTRQTTVKKALAREMKKREEGTVAPCPFLMKNNACMIYNVRPFACRRIYSLHVCSQERPPRLSRQFMALADQTLSRLQQIDTSGYSGHISYVLHMLEAPRFLETYLAGDFKPEEITAFGKTHGLVINKMVAGVPAGT